MLEDFLAPTSTIAGTMVYNRACVRACVRACAEAETTLEVVSSSEPTSQMLGGHKNADHANDARVQEVARFAVKEIGEKTNKSLDLVKVKSAQKQVVAGLNYTVVVETQIDGSKETYEARVYEALGNEPLKLTDHKQVDNE